MTEERRIPRVGRAWGWFLPSPRVCGEYTVQVDEGDRQMLCLALAELQRKYPGWDYAVGRIAAKLPNGAAMLADFLALRSSAPAEPGCCQSPDCRHPLAAHALWGCRVCPCDLLPSQARGDELLGVVADLRRLRDQVGAALDKALGEGWGGCSTAELAIEQLARERDLAEAGGREAVDHG